MSATVTLWAVIVAVGALNYLSRLSFIALFARIPMPAGDGTRAALRPGGDADGDRRAGGRLPGARASSSFRTPTRSSLAALVAAAIAWRTRSVTATMASGMIALWLVQWALSAASRLNPLPSSPPGHHSGPRHALRRHRHLRRHRRPDARGQRGDRARAAAAGQGRARHRQDDARRGGRARARRGRCCSGTSSRRPRRSRDSTSTTRCRGCATRSWATSRSPTSRNYIKRGVLWEAFEADRRRRSC